jgi:hypothetical protein
MAEPNRINSGSSHKRGHIWREETMSMKTRYCARCKIEIPAERIEALPETRVCVKCSEAIGGEFEMRAVPENLAKSGSLKKNYGSWTIVKRRKKLPAPE